MADHDDWVASARNNLGLSDAATKTVGTTAGTVAAGDRGIPDPTSVPDGRVLTTDTGVAVWQAPSGGRPMASGQWYPCDDIAAGNNLNPANNRIYWFPWTTGGATISGLSIYQTRSDAAGTLRLGIYGTTAGLPSALIYDSGPIAILQNANSVSGVATVLSPGLYWLAVASTWTSTWQADANTVRSRYVAAMWSPPAPPSAAMYAGYVGTVTSASDPLPASATITGVTDRAPTTLAAKIA